MAHGDRARPTKRTRKVVEVAVTLALSGLATVGCTSVHASAKAWGPERNTVISPQTTSTTSVPDSADDPYTPPPEAGSETTVAPTPTPALSGDRIKGDQPISDTKSCEALAKGPWRNTSYDSDPVAVVRAGRIPPFISGPDGTPLKVTEFPTVDDYNDHSTLGDPTKVYDAFTTAGYEEGIEASYVNGGEDTTVTVVRFRDAAGAKAALSAHLSDYCQKAIGGKSNTEGNGLIILRESKTVRTMFVMGDAEISVLVCECYGKTDADRQRFVEEWAMEVEILLAEPPPAQKPV